MNYEATAWEELTFKSLTLRPEKNMTIFGLKKSLESFIYYSTVMTTLYNSDLLTYLSHRLNAMIPRLSTNLFVSILSTVTTKSTMVQQNALIYLEHKVLYTQHIIFKDV